MSERYTRIRVQREAGPREGNMGRTRQEHADEANINKILGKWRRTGFVERVNINPALFGDFSEIPERHEAMNLFLDAQEQFSSRPC
jgi:hypothetical protein